MVETLAIKAAQQIALIRIAKKSLAARHRFHRGDGSLRDPACAIAPAREPDRIDVGAVRHRHQRGEPLRIFAREMAGDGEALRVEFQLDPRIAEADDRSEERREGKEWVSTCRLRW